MQSMLREQSVPTEIHDVVKKNEYSLVIDITYNLIMSFSTMQEQLEKHI